MKPIPKLTSLLFFVLLAGCIKENMDDCERTSLYFSYTGDLREQLFARKISQVDLFVFNAEDKTLQTKTVTQNELNKYQGTRLNLAPGTYRIICIGNAFNNTMVQCTGKKLQENYRIAHPNYFNGGEIQTNDSLYLGSAQISVPSNYWSHDTLSFRSSHLKVYVEVRGVATAEELTKATPGLRLLVRNCLPATDFSNQPCGEKVTYIPAATYDAEKRVLISRFNILRPTPDCSITFDLTDPADNLIFSLSLKDFLQQHPVIDLSQQEVLIPILIEFKSTTVMVTMPDWSIEQIRPEL